LTDVIVIGGGIAGCTTAYYLAKDGVDVTLLEKYELNTQASGSSAGSLHVQIQPEPFAEHGEAWARRYVQALPFYKESVALWQSVSTELGTDLEVACDGGLLIGSSEREMREIEAKARFDREGGLEIELLNARELRDIAPYVSETAVGAAYCAAEGKASPLLAAQAFAAAAQELGAHIREHSEVTGIRRTISGFAVKSATGEIEAARVVNAAGSEAGRVAALFGSTLKTKSFPIQLSITEPLQPLIGHLVYSASEMLTLKQTSQSTVAIGGGWPARRDNDGRPIVRNDSFRNNLAAAVNVVPALANASIVRSWAAFVNGNRSWLPVIGEIPGAKGFFINYVPWMGFSGAPAAARITASLLQGKEPPVNYDLSGFAP
jgi:glycine/D-amino acid oxidase-like deaminating enzyme